MDKIKIVNADYFSSIAAMVHHSIYNKSEYQPEQAIQIDSVCSHASILNVKSLLYSQGYCVVESDLPVHNRLSFYQQYLTTLFGKPISGKNTACQGYTKVQAVENAKFYFNSNLAQPMHTDEGHATTFPRYAALICEKEAVHGGDSIIVTLKLLYSALIQLFGNDIDLLFAKDAITIQNYQGVKKKPVLIYVDNGDIGITYSPLLRKMWCSRLVFEMFDCITQFIHTMDNQTRFKLRSGQVLIFDNCKIIHGRTSFLSNDARLLYRYWFQQVNV